LFYTKNYHSAPVRFLQSLFIQTPISLWYRLLAPCLYFWKNTTFDNDTALTDSQLLSIWVIAQQGLATQQIPMNTSGGALHAPDPRALGVQPKNIAVISVPDWSPADLAKIDPAWAGHAVPTGSFAANEGFAYETVSGITHTWVRPRIYGAQSVLGAVLVWEFQNVILDTLGYDVSNR
jgi:hypothetical protein